MFRLLCLHAGAALIALTTARGWFARGELAGAEPVRHAVVSGESYVTVTLVEQDVAAEEMSGFRRRPGGYLAIPKLLASWLLFTLWVWTADWISRDCLNVRQNYVVWNSVVFFPFVGALLLTIMGVPFVMGLTLMALTYVGSAVAYLYVRNASVQPHQRVLTPDHLRHLFTGEEKRAHHERGAPVDLIAQGGATERDNSANLLLARQVPGYVMVKNVIADLIQERGDAVMFDLTNDATAVRYQVDGIWHNNESQDRETGDFIVDVLKILSALNKSERRKKQVGKFQAAFTGEKYTCRLVSQGTQTGERAVLRLDQGRHPFHTLAELGMRDKTRAKFLEVLGGTRGFVLFSSMPMDGLTTTLDISLLETDRLLRNFVAVEDVARRELEIENVEVTTFNRAAGETPARLLPKLIRTYPDVIVVRDLSDLETVKILCQQVNENRLVIGTIRGKNAVDAMMRVLALKVPAADFAAAVSGVLYSRLIRKLCPTCKIGYEPTADVLKKLGIPQGRAQTFYREPNAEEVNKVCAGCGGIGYLGRTAIFELLAVDDGVRQVLAKSPQAEVVRKAARAAGMRSLHEEGILLVVKGVTSLPELMRVLKQ